MRQKALAWKMLFVLCLIAACLLPGRTAIGDEVMQVRIPAIASGADCIAELRDSNGHRVQLLTLTKDIGNAFVVECNGLKRFEYRASVFNEDTEEVRFDRTNYRIYVDVYYGANDQLQASVSIEVVNGSGGKLGMARFENRPIVPATPVPTAEPTISPTASPAPTATPPPYTVPFTFTKVWSGDREESIDWVMYNGDGTVRSKLFNKKEISENEWQYEAYFQESVADCYIVEYVPEGYKVRYENIGAYAHVEDRCYNDGTIYNDKVPQTGDTQPLYGAIVCAVLSAGGLCLLMKSSRKQKET